MHVCAPFFRLFCNAASCAAACRIVIRISFVQMNRRPLYVDVRRKFTYRVHANHTVYVRRHFAGCGICPHYNLFVGMFGKHIICKRLHKFIVVISIVIFISRAPACSLFGTSSTATTGFLVGETEHKIRVRIAPSRHRVIHTCFYKGQCGYCIAGVFQNTARITNIRTVGVKNPTVICLNVRLIQTNGFIGNFTFHQGFDVLCYITGHRGIYRIRRRIFRPMPSVGCKTKFDHFRPIGDRISHRVNT